MKKKKDLLALLKASKGKKFRQSPSPFMRWLEPRVLDAVTGQVEFEYVLRAEMRNALNVAHGGILAALLDDVVSATVYTFNEDHYYTTLHNVIDYFSPALAGDKLRAKTRVLKKGRRLLHIECEILQQDTGKTVARGNSTLIKTSIPKYPGAENRN